MKRAERNNTHVRQMECKAFPLVERFQRSRWSASRLKIHDLGVGEEVILPKFDRNNICTSVERIEEAYEHTRRYHIHKRNNCILVRRSL